MSEVGMDRATNKPVVAPDTVGGVKPARPFLPEGLAEGTTVLTLDGAIPVEHLQNGDLIIARNRGPVALRAIHSRTLQAVRPVMLAPDALGSGNPEFEIIMAPGQRVMLRGQAAMDLTGHEEATVNILNLCDNRSMMQAKNPIQVQIFTLDFEVEQVIYAAGIEVVCAPSTQRSRRPNTTERPAILQQVATEPVSEMPQSARKVTVRRVKPRPQHVLVLSNDSD